MPLPLEMHPPEPRPMHNGREQCIGKLSCAVYLLWWQINGLFSSLVSLTLFLSTREQIKKIENHSYKNVAGSVSFLDCHRGYHINVSV